jgi:hypothetical protein
MPRCVPRAQLDGLDHRFIALAALEAMAGAIFVLDDPLFPGFAVSLPFGLFVSTVPVAIPVVD